MIDEWKRRRSTKDELGEMIDEGKRGGRSTRDEIREMIDEGKSGEIYER
jgi:hypothetical protein